MEHILLYSQSLYDSVPASCTYRKHSSKHVREVHSMKQLSVNDLKEYSCPRLSVVDLIRLINTSSVLIVDVRMANEY